MIGLSEEQRRGFETNGYLIVRGAAGPQELQRLRQRAEAALEARQPPLELEAEVNYPGAPASAEAPGGDTVRRLLEAYQRDPVFRDWALDPRVGQRVSDLLGGGPVKLVLSHHNCVMTKHPRFSSETQWHQDARYWRFQRPELISAWLALGREVQANGGIMLIPGSHRMGFDPARYDEALFLRPDLPENQALIEQAVLAELEPGDLLLFHAMLFHAAGRNLTERRKFALVYTYRAEDNPPLPDSKSTRLPEVPVPIKVPV